MLQQQVTTSTTTFTADILLCPPTHFDIEYEINPWMHVDNKVDKPAAMACYQELKNTYLSLGARVSEIHQTPGLPDMVYMADTGHAVDGTFIRANFRYPERRQEAFVVAEYMQRERGLETVTLPEGIFFEGHGDLIVGDTYFMGYGKRSMIEAVPHLQKYITHDIVPIELVDPYYYHLDTCFAVLKPGVALINPTSFTSKGLTEIRSRFDRVIEASKADHQVLGCNLVTVGDHLITATGITPDLQKEFTDLGFTLHLIDTLEYRKGGGSVKCMSFEF